MAEHSISTFGPFLEVGTCVLISRVLPQQTTYYWTGRQNPDRVADRQYRMDPKGLAYLRGELNARNARCVFVHVPMRTNYLWARNALRRLHGDCGGRAYHELIHANDLPIVGMDFNDYARLSSTALEILDRSVCYFKRELPVDRNRLLPPNPTARQRSLLAANEHKLRPISLGLCRGRQAAMPDSGIAKQYDLFFSGALNCEVRRAGFPLLEELQRQGIKVHIPPSRVDRPEFLRMCAQSRLVWSPEGCGWDCFRHYESAGAGSVPVMNAPWIVPYRPLNHGTEALYYQFSETPSWFQPPQPFVETVLQALNDRDRLDEMACNARRHVNQFHTHEAIVDHIVKTVVTEQLSSAPNLLGVA